MKKWLASILLTITITGTFIPCCLVDECCADQSISAASHEDHESEGTCSPFFACATCPCFVEITTSIQLSEPIIEKQVHHEKVIVYNFTTYPASCWQPPRPC